MFRLFYAICWIFFETYLILNSYYIYYCILNLILLNCENIEFNQNNVDILVKLWRYFQRFWVFSQSFSVRRSFFSVIIQNAKIELAWINGNLFVKAHHQWKGRLFSLLLLFFLFFSALWVISKWWLNFPVKFVGWGPHPPLFDFTLVSLLSIFSPTVVLWFDDNQKSLFFLHPPAPPFRGCHNEAKPTLKLHFKIPHIF